MIQSKQKVSYKFSRKKNDDTQCTYILYYLYIHQFYAYRSAMSEAAGRTSTFLSNRIQGSLRKQSLPVPRCWHIVVSTSVSIVVSCHYECVIVLVLFGTNMTLSTAQFSVSFQNIVTIPLCSTMRLTGLVYEQRVIVRCVWYPFSVIQEIVWMCRNGLVI